MIPCPSCAKEISDQAVNCPQCGHPINAPTAVANAPSPGIAAVCSFFIPGLGQMYAGQPLQGLLWLGFVLAGYLFLIPGLVLHLICIVHAYGVAKGKASGAAKPMKSGRLSW